MPSRPGLDPDPAGPRSSEVAFLLAEASRWRDEGLLDESTHRRICERYRFASPRSLEAELSEEADRILAREEAPAPPLEVALEAEVAHLVSVEEEILAARTEAEESRATLTATPVEARPVELGVAVAAAVLDLAGPPAVDEPPPTDEARAIDAETGREGRGWRWLRPFLYENALWLAGGLLVVFGSLYFLRLSWDRLSSLGHHLIIAGGLHLYAGAFFGVGYALARRRGAHGVGQILHAFALAILPIGSLAVGELVAVLPGLRGAGAGLALLGVLLALGSQAVLLYLIGGLADRASARTLTGAGLTLALLAASIAGVERFAGAGGLALLALPLAFLALAHGLLRLVRDRVVVRSTVFLVGGGLLWSFAVLLARVHWGTPIAPTHHALTLAALAALLLTVDHRLRLRAGNPARLSALGLGLLGAELLALALAFVGLGRLGYFDLGARLVTLGCAATATATLGWAAVRHGRGLCTQLAAASGLVTYFFLPAPFAAILLLAQRWIAGALGYADQPLPVAFYGLTFVPYLGLLLWLAARLRGRRPDLSRDLQRFLIAISGLLCLLAFAGAGDRRPMLWAWPLYATLAYLGALLFARPRLIYAGHALVLASAAVLGLELAPRAPLLGPSVLLASCALLAAAAALRAREKVHLLHAALAAVALGLAIFFVELPPLRVALLALGLLTLALALITSRTASRVAATLTACAAIAAVLCGHGCVGAWESRSLLWYLLGWGSAAVIGVALLRGAEAGSRTRRLLVEPATLFAAVLLFLALPAALFHSAGSSLLPALALVLLAWLARGWFVLALAGLVFAVSIGWNAQELFPMTSTAAPLALHALAALYLVGAGALGARKESDRPPLWNARRRAFALAVVGALTAMVALAIGVGLAFDAETTIEQSWRALLAAGGAALPALALAHAHRARGLRGALALALFAFASSVTAFLLLRTGLLSLGPSTGELWHYGTLAAALGFLWLLLANRLSTPLSATVARGVAAIGCAVPLVPLAGLLVLGLLQCGPGGGWTLALGGLEAGAAALACAGLTLFSASRLVGSLPGLGRELRTAALVGLALILYRLAVPAGHLVLPLGLSAVALAAWVRRGEGVSSLGWPIALVTLALCASHSHLRTPLPAVALAAGAVVSALGWRRAEGGRRIGLALGWSIGALLVAQAATVWLAAVYSTGRHPAAALAALAAPAALLSGLVVEAVARRLLAASRLPDRSLASVLVVARLAYLASALLALVAVWGCASALPAFVLWSALATLAGAGLALARAGLRDRREWALHAALLTVPLLYHLLRTWTALSSPGLWLDAGAILLGSALLLAASRALSAPRDAAASVAVRPLTTAALGWPLAGLLLLARLEPAHGALLCFLIALHYLAAQRALHAPSARHLTVAVLLHANLALARIWSSLGWSDLMLTALPVGLTMLCLIQVYRAELGRSGSHVLRSLTLVAVYTIGLVQALTALTPLQGLVVVPSLCVLGIVAGMLFRVRAYALWGVGFLAADLTLNLLRYGLSSPTLGALFLTLLRLLVVTSMVVFSLERERVLRRYSVILGELRTWD